MVLQVHLSALISKHIPRAFKIAFLAFLHAHQAGCKAPQVTCENSVRGSSGGKRQTEEQQASTGKVSNLGKTHTKDSLLLVTIYIAL